MTALDDIARLLHEHCGFSKEHLDEGAVRRMAEGRSLSLSAYRDTLEASSHELNELVQALVVPETYFFRHPESFAAMREWIANFPRRPIRILCAACSTGEEPYSVAMSLLEAGFAREDFAIEAWDLSSKAIAIAMKGVYSASSFRGAELAWRADHFMPCEGGWRISEQVRHLVKFRHGNLFDLHAASAFDVVFCRNVLIYFSTVRQQQALHGLSRALADDGILFLGPAEPPILPAGEWRMTPYSMSFSCVKRPHTTPPWRPPAVAAKIRPSPARRVTPRPVPVSDPVHVSPGNLLDEANALADRGRLSEAKKVLKKALAAEPQNPRAHCLMGIVEEASGEAGLAEASYRKSIYLDPSQIDALQHMVLLLERQGRSQAAEQWRRRARKHASP